MTHKEYLIFTEEYIDYLDKNYLVEEFFKRVSE